MINITVYTPICENYEVLNILYRCLISQTDINFCWFIVDYGESPEAENYVNLFSKEGFLRDIKLTTKPFVGRHLATEYAFKAISTKYIVGLDGNYFLENDAIQILKSEWANIESEHSSVAEIRAYARRHNGEFIGNSRYFFEKGSNRVDMTWHKMVLANKNYCEMLASWNKEKFLSAVDISSYHKESSKLKDLETRLFWASLGRKYNTRYLNRSLKIQIISEDIDLKLNRSFQVSMHGSVFFLKENAKYYFYNPRYFHSEIIRVFKLILLRLTFRL